MGEHRPTLADVAAAAQVSVSTASLAFSGAGPITDATRDRVLEAAQRIAYAGPNPLGRQLRSGRSGIVGVVIGDSLRRSFRDPVSVQVLDGLVDTLGALGLGVLLIPGAPGEAGLRRVDPLIESAAMDVAVLIWGVGREDPTLTALQRRGIPVVVGEGRPVDGAPLVGIHDRAGTTRLVRHLEELGHRRLAAVTLPFGPHRRQGPVPEDSLDAADWAPTINRLAGVRDAGVRPLVHWETPGSLVEHGRDAALAILDPRHPDHPADLGRPPTAILAQSDLLAAGAVLGARELGLRVPQDVSVAGFDGLDLPWFAPDRLTTVRQPLAEKGAAIGRAVQGVLDGREPETVVLDVELVLGTTTGPASGDV